MPDYFEFSVYVKRPGFDKLIFADYLTADGQVYQFLMLVLYHDSRFHKGLRRAPKDQQAGPSTKRLSGSRPGQYG